MATKNKGVKRRDTEKLVVLNEEELIRQVELRPILYDKSLKGYRKSGLRYQYWKEVGDVVGARVEECRRRWRSLRDAFSKHYKYLNRTDESVYSKKKKWVFYDQMQFIAPYLENTHCEIEDTLLEDFPDNSEDDHTMVFEDDTKTYQLSTVDNPDDISHHEDEIKSMENADMPNSALGGTENTFCNIISPEEDVTREEPSKNDRSPSLNLPQNETLKASLSNMMAMSLDSDEKFLLSCAPILRRLPRRKNAYARLKIQQILYDIEFESEEK